jgi:hypothetical protein
MRGLRQQEDNRYLQNGNENNNTAYVRTSTPCTCTPQDSDSKCGLVRISISVHNLAYIAHNPTDEPVDYYHVQQSKSVCVNELVEVCVRMQSSNMYVYSPSQVLVEGLRQKGAFNQDPPMAEYYAK